MSNDDYARARMIAELSMPATVLIGALFLTFLEVSGCDALNSSENKDAYKEQTTLVTETQPVPTAE